MFPSQKNTVHILQSFLKSTTNNAMFIAWLCLVYLLPMTSSSNVETSTAAAMSHKDANPKSLLLQMHDSEKRLFSHFKEPYTYRIRGQLRINVSEITTSSILVKWHLSNRTFNDSFIKAIVVCETFSGMIVSKAMVSSKASHRIDGLQSDSSYILCVDMLEKAPQVNVTVLHFTCHNAATIPVLRSDSIIGVILTLGYIFLMAAIGYFMWRKRSRELNEDKIPINVEDDDEDEDEEDGGKSEPFGRVGPSSKGKYATNGSNNKKPSDRKYQGIIGAVNSSAPETTTSGLASNAGEGGANNGCLDYGQSKRKSKSRDDVASASLLCGTTDAEMEDRKPSTKSRHSDSSPVKITEIAF